MRTIQIRLAILVSVAGIGAADDQGRRSAPKAEWIRAIAVPAR